MTDYDSVYAKASANGYKNTDPLPERPKIPDLLRKAPRDLTTAEVETLPGVHAAHIAVVADYNEAYAAWKAKDAELGAAFEPELAAEHGVTDNPKRALLYDIAWDQGHAYGHTEVAIHYQQLAELIK
jgi:hypothetical protein